MNASSFSEIPLSLDTRVGILGGGQLAMMLAQAASRMGLRPVVLAKNPQDPAARVCPDVVYGELADRDALGRFYAGLDLVAFENEFVSVEALRAAARPETLFVPTLDTLFRLQNKLRQKEILRELAIPSAPYAVYDPAADLEAWLAQVARDFAGGFVLKWAQAGYDGKGVWLPPAGAATETLKAEMRAFCERAVKAGAAVYAEALVPFKRELALVSSYSTRGEFAAYPLVVIEQPGGICRWVKGPATGLGVAPAREAEARDVARRLAQALSLHGTFAIEFFEMADRLWVNEISPRVHNSGHFTQDAARTSQFENHWRALLGLPLGDTTSAPGFAMLNLLGPAKPPAGRVPLPRPGARQHLHWYGKSALAPGRKLGHLNGACDTAAEVEGLVASLQACEAAWLQSLQKA